MRPEPRRLVLDRGVPPDAPRLERQDEDVRQPGLAGEHGVGGHHQIAAMRTRIPSGPVFDTAAWRGRVRACGSRRGERRVGGHGSRAAGAARESATHPSRSGGWRGGAVAPARTDGRVVEDDRARTQSAGGHVYGPAPRREDVGIGPQRCAVTRRHLSVGADPAQVLVVEPPAFTDSGSCTGWCCGTINAVRFKDAATDPTRNRTSHETGYDRSR